MIATIAQESLDWQFGGETAELRVFADRTFFTSDGVAIVGSQDGFYQTVACRIEGSTLTIPSFQINSTADSSDPSATYVPAFYDAQGRRLDADFPPFRVPISSAPSLTWPEIRAYTAQTASPPEVDEHD